MEKNRLSAEIAFAFKQARGLEHLGEGTEVNFWRYHLQNLYFDWLYGGYEVDKLSNKEQKQLDFLMGLLNSKEDADLFFMLDQIQKNQNCVDFVDQVAAWHAALLRMKDQKDLPNRFVRLELIMTKVFELVNKGELTFKYRGLSDDFLEKFKTLFKEANISENVRIKMVSCFLENLGT